MRYELSDYEWSVIRSMLPNKATRHSPAICQTALVPLRRAMLITPDALLHRTIGVR
jgi:hypothetical protein